MTNHTNNDSSHSPGGFNESDFQDGIVRRIEDFGWLRSADQSLGRPSEDVIRAEDLLPALVRLNPVIAEDTLRGEQMR